MITMRGVVMMSDQWRKIYRVFDNGILVAGRQEYTPPVAEKVLFWNRNANMKHAENSYRVGCYAMENTCDCSHWMPYTEGMEIPAPPTDFAFFDNMLTPSQDMTP